MRNNGLGPLIGLWLMALALGATCSGNTTPPTDSGIEGLVTIGPTCPVERIDTPCPDQPYQALIVVQDKNGSEVTRVKSGQDGRFRVELAPGVYTLVPQSPNQGGLPFAREQNVEVRAGAFTQVTIGFDSGIR